MKIYNVYFPDGQIKKFKTKYNNERLPALERVFCVKNNKKIFYFEIVEIGSNDIWVEEISKQHYQYLIDKPTLEDGFCHFQSNHLCEIIEY